MEERAQTPEKMNWKKKLNLSLHSKYRKNEARIHDLNYIFWECTLRCNLSCRHCGSDCIKDSAVPDMPVEDFIRAIGEVKGHINPNKTMIAITGGEPLLRNDLEIAGVELNKRGFPWGIVTNGYNLSEGRLNTLLDAGLKSITISLDGLKESHDWFRNREGSYEKALEAIKLVSSVKGLTFDVATCAYKKNIDELEEIYDLLLNTGVNYWRLFTVFPRGRAVHNEILRPDKELLIRLFEIIKEKRSEGKLIINYGCEGYLGDYEGEVRDYYFFCHAGINIGSVLVDGSISACPSLRGDFIQGNIYKDNFWDVWENRFGIMRDRKWTKTGICENCDSYKWCCGSALHLRTDGNKDIMFCHLQEMKK